MSDRPRSALLDEVLDANARYSESFGDKGGLAIPPARRFAVLTCMDARLDPAKFAGLAEGDAHVIRNAGGRASDDAIRSLVISHKLLGTREWFVVHHTNCGMELFTDDIMGDLLAGSLETASFDGATWSNPRAGGGSPAGRFVKWLTIADQARSVTDDVQRIRSHPLVPGTIPIYGLHLRRGDGAASQCAVRDRGGPGARVGHSELRPGEEGSRT